MENHDLQAGMSAPDFELRDAYGKVVSLSHFHGRPLILVFIRHTGSLYCRAHLSYLRKQYGKVQHLGGEIIVISFGEPKALQKLIHAHKLPFVVLADPPKHTYRLYGMIYRETGPVKTWKTVMAYLKLRLAGYPKPPPEKDERQMGGDLIIDRKGIIRFLHRSQFPEDRPDTFEMVNLLAGLEG
ncbi:MAG: peroxiredoxin-like family protein [Bacillota bacterium]|nr:peroxiredoxin-like family protein [Bacillota bacterium]MDW7683128.1 peroxiredoxin-like family protein [Bacillota bacterium]